MEKRQNYQWDKYEIGVCYYPEQWPEELWENDLQRMKDAGISTVRVAEFAWSKVEMREGEFEFSFWDRFLDLCSEYEMKVIFGTPTATPPVWLTEKYPEVLNARKDGVLYRHGGRRHYNYNSETYQRLCRRIVTKLAEHYGKHPAIVGWQIDNELNCETYEFYSEADTKAFREFLKTKYETLDALNQAWGTVFWNQTYTEWEQIYVPGILASRCVNPHQHLDYLRFISESAIRFCKMQADIIREYKKPEDFVTTNGMFWPIDNHRMEKECLDVYTYDSYPSFAYGLSDQWNDNHGMKDRISSRYLNEVRSICPHFGVMEQQSGANGWTTCMEGPVPRPGQLSLWAMQSVAHGADYISFFRWRTATMGTEIYWHGILDYDNRDNRKLSEVKALSEKLEAISEVCGGEYVSSFALLKDYDNEWDKGVDSWHKRVAEPSEDAIFITAEKMQIPYDAVYFQKDTEAADLQKYPVLIYPHPVITDEKKVSVLKEYVKQGGTLLIGCRSGYKDNDGKCVMLPQPGLFKELTGTDIKEFTFTSPAEEATYAFMGEGKIETPIFNDVLIPEEDTRVLAEYGNSFYKGAAAFTEHAFGKGRVLHFGSTFSMQNLPEILAEARVTSPFEKYAEAEESVELVLRKKNGYTYLFALNYEGKEAEIDLKKTCLSMYDNKTVSGKIKLAPYETAVYKVI